MFYKLHLHNNTYYWTQWAGDTIPTATPTFATMPDTSLALPTLPDVGWLQEIKMTLPKFKMATAKPEVEIIFQRW